MVSPRPYIWDNEVDNIAQALRLLSICLYRDAKRLSPHQGWPDRYSQSRWLDYLHTPATHWTRVYPAWVSYIHISVKRVSPLTRINRSGYLCHGISPTEKTQERMSMVTSYRPADPFREDCSILRGVRSQSDVPTLYRDWSAYRLRVLAARAIKLAEDLEKAKSVKEGLVEGLMEQFVKEQTAYLSHTVKEMSGPMGHEPTDTRKAFLDWKLRQGNTSVVSA